MSGFITVDEATVGNLSLEPFLEFTKVYHNVSFYVTNRPYPKSALMRDKSSYTLSNTKGSFNVN